MDGYEYYRSEFTKAGGGTRTGYYRISPSGEVKFRNPLTQRDMNVPLTAAELRSKHLTRVESADVPEDFRGQA